MTPWQRAAAYVNVLACESTTEPTQAPEDRWPKPFMIIDECAWYCHSDCRVLDEADCRSRCMQWIHNAEQIDRAGGSGCLTSVVDAFECFALTECGLPPETYGGLCNLAVVAQSEACATDPLAFLGWETCHRQCDFIIDVCRDDVNYGGWWDCHSQCKANLLQDWSGDCLSEGLRLRQCIAGLRYCALYELFMKDDPSSPCATLDLEWQACVSING